MLTNRRHSGLDILGRCRGAQVAQQKGKPTVFATGLEVVLHPLDNLRRFAGSQKSSTHPKNKGQVVLLGILLVPLGTEFRNIRIRELTPTPSTVANSPLHMIPFPADASFTDEMREVHHAITCPVQLIWGDRDPWFKLRGARACLPQFKEVELEVLPGKLFVHEEHPARFAELAESFLERVLAPEVAAAS